MRLVSIFTSLVIVCCVDPARAQSCQFAEERWVGALTLGAHANWDEDDAQSAKYNPPTGWVVLETKVHVNSEHRGSHSVSVIAGGANFAAETDFESARSYLLDIEAKGRYQQYGGEFLGRIDLTCPLQPLHG
jgi:hypothetical protein